MQFDYGIVCPKDKKNSVTQYLQNSKNLKHCKFRTYRVDDKVNLVILYLKFSCKGFK